MQAGKAVAQELRGRAVTLTASEDDAFLPHVGVPKAARKAAAAAREKLVLRQVCL